MVTSRFKIQSLEYWQEQEVLIISMPLKADPDDDHIVYLQHQSPAAACVSTCSELPVD